MQGDFYRLHFSILSEGQIQWNIHGVAEIYTLLISQTMTYISICLKPPNEDILTAKHYIIAGLKKSIASKISKRWR